MEMQKHLKKIRVSHKVTPIKVEKIIPKKSYALSETQILVKEIAREINGLAPYELKAIDMIKADEYKAAKKFLKKRLGSLKRAEKKFEILCQKAR